MKKNFRRLIAFFLTVTILTSFNQGFAQEGEDIYYLMPFINAVVLSEESSIYFGTVTFKTMPKSRNDVIILNNDGSITYKGTFKGSNRGAPGSIRINSGSQETVDIFCENEITLTHGSSSINLSNISVTTPSDALLPSTAENSRQCNGFNGTAASSLILNSEDMLLNQFYLGGQINGLSAKNFREGLYTSIMHVEIVYQ